jgi:Holliday junction resolvase
MNDVDKLVAFNIIRTYLNEEQQQELLKTLALDPTNLVPRLRGLNVEAEFFVILHLLQCCKHILSFDEGTSVLSQSYSPDSCLVLKNDEKIFIEIKSKEEFTYKISGGNLQKRIDFAEEFGFKLFFAVKLESFWGLYTSEYLKSKNGKLTCPDDYNNSDFEEIFGSQLIIVPEGIKVESYYSPDKKALAGIGHSAFGNLYSYKLYFQDKLIFNINETNESEVVFSIVLEALHDEMSKQFQDVSVMENNTTLITEKLLKNSFFYDYNFLLSHIYHTQTDLGYLLDASTFYKSVVAERGKTHIDRDLLHKVIGLMQENGVPIIISTLKKETQQENTAHNISSCCTTLSYIGPSFRLCPVQSPFA